MDKAAAAVTAVDNDTSRRADTYPPAQLSFMDDAPSAKVGLGFSKNNGPEIDVGNLGGAGIVRLTVV